MKITSLFIQCFITWHSQGTLLRNFSG